MKKFFTSCAALLLAAPMLLAQNPEKLYLVGNMNDWSTPDNNNAVELTSANNDGIYTGTISYESPTLEFKIWSNVGGDSDWNTYAWGTPSGTTSVFLDANTPYTWNLVENSNGAQNVAVANWVNEGNVSVNWNDKTVSITASEVGAKEHSVSIAGIMTDWANSAQSLTQSADNANIYTGSLTVDEGNCEFKIIIDGAWYNADGSDGKFDLYSNKDYTTKLISNNGANLSCTNWVTGTLNVSVNVESMELTVSSPTQPEYVVELPTALYMAGTMNGWNAGDSAYVLKGSDGVYTGTFSNVSIVADAEGNMPKNLSFKFTNGTWDFNWGASGNYDEAIDGVLFDLYANKANEATLVENGSNFVVTNWVDGGSMEVTVDLNNNTLSITASGQPNWNPSELYLVGNFNNWAAPDNEEFERVVLTSTQNGIYSCTLNYDNTKLEFKVFDAITSNWEANSYGVDNGDAVQLFPDEEVNWNMVLNGSNITITNWGGTGTITVNLNTNTITVVAPVVSESEEPEGPETAPEQIYIIGACQGWDINSDVMTLELEGEATYSGTFEITQGDFMLRFYTELGDWNTANASIGAQVIDEPLDITFTEDAYSGSCVYGKGSWSYPEWEGGPVTFFVDLNNMTVKFTNTLSGVEINPIQTVENFNVYNMQGVKVLNTTDASSLNNLKGMYIINGKKVVLR